MKIISDENFENELKLIAEEYGYILNDNVCHNLNIYKKLLVEWNEKMNLTGITENYEVIIKHFIDCLECTKYIDEKEKIIDVGTGAGFPGMVIAIYFEDKLDITLLDSLNKRLIFLEEVKKQIGFKNIKIVHDRAEDAAHKLEFREKFDKVVARAVAPLNNLLEFTSGYIRKNGTCLFMKGDSFREEVESSKNAIKILNCKISNIYEYNLKLNDEQYNRVILDIQKNNLTPKSYPRSYGKIKKNPL